MKFYLRRIYLRHAGEAYLGDKNEGCQLLYLAESCLTDKTYIYFTVAAESREEAKNHVIASFPQIPEIEFYR